MWFIWVPEYISRYLDFNSAPPFSDVQNGQIIGDSHARHDFDDGGAASAVGAFNSIRLPANWLQEIATVMSFWASSLDASGESGRDTSVWSDFFSSSFSILGVSWLQLIRTLIGGRSSPLII
jgi:hypothetical protein